MASFRHGILDSANHKIMLCVKDTHYGTGVTGPTSRSSPQGSGFNMYGISFMELRGILRIPIINSMSILRNEFHAMLHNQKSHHYLHISLFIPDYEKLDLLYSTTKKVLS